MSRDTLLVALTFRVERDNIDRLSPRRMQLIANVAGADPLSEDA